MLKQAHSRESGFGLIELIATIVIVSVAAVGLATAVGMSAKSSALPIQRVQALSLARMLMAEVVKQPFTFCDPDDAQFSTATATVSCTGSTAGSQDPGSLTGPVPVTEVRNSASITFDNIADYAGYSMQPVVTPDGQIWNGFSARFDVAYAGSFLSASDGEALRVTVTVNAVASDGLVLDTVILDGYRSRHAPNSGVPLL